MAKTEDDIVDRVASDLSLVGSGLSAEAEEDADIRQRLTTIVAELNARKVLYVPDLDAVPDEVFEPLVEYVVLKAGPGYGRPAAAQAELDAIEDRMRDITRSVAPRRTLTTDPMFRHGRSRGIFDPRRG